MQVDVEQSMPPSADTVEHVMGGVGITPLSNAFMVGRFSLDVKDHRGVGLDYKVSSKTFI